MEVQDNQRTLSFASVSGKQVEAVFDGGVLTSDMGLMLLREVASKTSILSRIVAACRVQYGKGGLMSRMKPWMYRWVCLS